MDIAIIGISCRLPNNINSIDDLYQNIINKVDCLEPHKRLSVNKYYDSNNNDGKIINTRGGYINELFNFDNKFFKISAKEAKSMDPQQRQLLELTYECILDSKINMDKLKGTKTGVFVGACSNEYHALMMEKSENINEYGNTGGLSTLLSNRISYNFDLKGPSLTLDTACSSSGYALHLACQSIINGESDQCFVGGANVLLKPESTIAFSQAKMLSPDGKCQSFDDKANGYVRSEGFSVVMIKPLKDAIKNNDNIYTIIKKTAVNQDGKTPSITFPNIDSQMSLLESLYSKEDIEKTIYIEAHGTGTEVGDKNEAKAIGTIIGNNKKDTLYIGSVKSNIGHTEPTSGLASILKVCAIMKYNKLIPNIHFDTPSKNINFEDNNIKVITDIIEIKKDDYIIGVNNFGFGGANFHCKLQNYKNSMIDKDKSYYSKYQVLPIYGTDRNNLEDNIVKWYESDEKDFMLNIYNQNKFCPLEMTALFIIKDKEEFNKLVFSEFNSTNARIIKTNTENVPELAFVFCGQGPQHIKMGFELYQDYSVFKNAIDQLDSYWKEIAGESFLDKYKLFKTEYKYTGSSDLNIQIDDPIVAQPAILFYQIGLIEVYKSFNIIPSKVIGHSAGEIASFYCANSISLKDAIKISYYRSIYQQMTAGTGNMLVVGITKEELDLLLERKNFVLDNLEEACVNDYNSTVIAGPSDEINKLNKILKDENIFNAIIRGRCPFHSSLQNIIKEKILDATKDIIFNEPDITLISTVTGEEINKENYHKDYWWKNIRDRVNFANGIKSMDNIDIFIEIGPHPILVNNINSILIDKVVLSSSNRKEDSSLRLMTSISDIWSYGYMIKNNFGIPNNTNCINHVWDKSTEFINEPEISYNRRNGIYHNHNILSFSKNEFSYIKDHIIGDNMIFPTVGYIDIICRYFNNAKNLIIHDVEINNMYIPTDDNIVFNVEKYNNNVKLNSKDNKINFFKCIVNEDDGINEKFNLDNYIENCHSNIDDKEAYNIMKFKNFNFGSQMKSISKFYYGDSYCIIELKENLNENYLINPVYLDSCLTSSIIYMSYLITITYLPTKIDKIVINTEGRGKAKYVFTQIIECDYNNMIQESYLLDEDYMVICKMENIISTNVSKEIIKDHIFKLNWIEASKEEQQHLPDIMSNEPDVEKDKRVFKITNETIYDIHNLLKTNRYDYFIIDYLNDGIIEGYLKSFLNEKNNGSLILTNDLNSELIDDIVKGIYENSNTFKIIDNNVLVPSLESYLINNKHKDRYYFDIKVKGNLNTFGYLPLTLYDLPDNYVEIDVKASALNFKDLMVSLDIVKSDHIGYELAGIIKKSNTNEFKKGDIVFASPNKSGKGISNVVQCDSKYVFMSPCNLNFFESASIGLIFGTSYISLIKRANIDSTSTVLVHSAMGGIGQACIAICKMVGANIIATAGTEEKREILRNKFGIKYVSNSRDPEIFKKEILEFTDDKGVDVIINSLSGKALQFNFDIIAKHGTIVEIGKKDILNNNKINLSRFIDSITLTSVHFDELLETNNKMIKKVMKELCQLFESNKIKPIQISKYHISEAENTLKLMKKGIHTGKLILSVDDWVPEKQENELYIFDPNLYYIVTGGTGGLGIELINWMYSRNARKFILMSRSGNLNYRGNFVVNKLKSLGCSITIEKIDITNQNELIEFYNNNYYKVDGIFHLAGIIKDNMIDNMTEKDIELVLKPKVDGTKNLDLLSKNYNLRYFVMFSSISSLIGNVGQANYSAANSYMDKFSIKRKKLGLPSTCINVGAIGGAGMIDRKISKLMRSNGFNFIHFYEFFENMARILQDFDANNICISNQDLNILYKNYPSLKMLEKHQTDENNNVVEKDLGVDIINKIKELLEVDIIDRDKNLVSYGIDSILSMELSSWLKEEFRINIKQIDIIQGISVNQILSKFNINYVNISNVQEDLNNNILTRKINKKIKEIDINPSSNESINQIIEKSNDNYTNLIYITLLVILGIIYFYI
jgi:acyl transferase domain-containing protein/NADPH:quinone reductase-like Zn-dependent oxidoreductase/NAD(P)-dependent dehydrogenase (short-subunit alcohol dehydrogenase family)/acyl carrier protein